MNLIHSLTLIIHILAGTAAMILFWAPAIAKKGSPNHIRFGRYYVNAMYAIAASGFVMALLVIIDPIGLHSDAASNITDPEKQATVIRSFWSFLMYLSLLTVATLRHGVLVLKYKKDRKQLTRLGHLSLMTALTVLGPVLAIWGYQIGMTLLIIFGCLGLFLGGSMLHYCFKSDLSKMQWWIEHLGSMIGSGIAAYTAFFSFGVRRLLEDYATLQLLSWILPGVIGTIVIQYLTRHYRKKFANKQPNTSTTSVV